MFTALARKDLSLLGVCDQVQSSAMVTVFDDAALNSLFWIRANYYQPVDPPDTTRLSWREVIIQCLESVYIQSRAQPNSEHSPPSPHSVVHQPELTVDRSAQAGRGSDREMGRHEAGAASDIR